MKYSKAKGSTFWNSLNDFTMCFGHVLVFHVENDKIEKIRLGKTKDFIHND